MSRFKNIEQTIYMRMPEIKTKIGVRGVLIAAGLLLLITWSFGIKARLFVIIISFLAVVSIMASRKKDKLVSSILELAKQKNVEIAPFEKPEHGFIEINENGFKATDFGWRNEDIPEIRWADVDKISVFKCGLLFINFTFCRFHDCVNNRNVEVEEQMLGYKQLMKAVEKRYGVRQEDWFKKVALPPFITNLTVIWSKE